MVNLKKFILVIVVIFIILVSFIFNKMGKDRAKVEEQITLPSQENIIESADEMLISIKTQVLFFNPGGKEDVGVWNLVSNFMIATAQDLDIDLEILYAERNHQLMVEQVEGVVLRTKHPDYAIIVNEKLMGARMLLSLKDIKTKIIVIHNDITPEQRESIGNEREEISNWIGSIVTDEYQAGYKQISQLFKHTEKEPKIAVISGDIATPVSKIRENGLTDYISQVGRGELYQIINGNWSFEDGKEKATGLLERYPDVNIIWSSNDTMALGAYAAVLEKGLQDDISVGGLGGFPDALKSIKQNELRVSVGGHAMIGGWALVLISDYNNGNDFINDIGLSYKVDDLSIIDSGDKADLFQELVYDHPEKIDFRKLTKSNNLELLKYDFSYNNIVNTSK